MTDRGVGELMVIVESLIAPLADIDEAVARISSSNEFRKTTADSITFWYKIGVPT